MPRLQNLTFAFVCFEKGLFILSALTDFFIFLIFTTFYETHHFGNALLKAIGQIFLQTLAIDNLDFTESQVAILESIAEGCPLSDGEAVLRARAMLQLSQESPLNYNDIFICGGGERTKKADGAVQSVCVYPNPADGLVTVEYIPTERPNTQFLLFNTLGQVVRSVTLPQGETSLKLSLSDLPEGVYWYMVSGLPNASDKLLINHS